MADIMTMVLVAAGAVFCVIGGVGVLRMPDFYTRCHAAAVADTAGAAFILMGLTFQAGFSLVSVKLLMVLAFLWLTGPASTHALAKAAFAGGLKAK